MSICFADIFVWVVAPLTIVAVSALNSYVISESVRFRKDTQRKVNEMKDTEIHCWMKKSADGRSCCQSQERPTVQCCTHC